MSNSVVVIVLGYGCHLSEAMKGYLDQVIAFVSLNEVAAVIATGGFTNGRTAPGVSEAALIADYLGRHGIHVYKEESSLTTNDNLHSVAPLVGQQQFKNCEIVIFCDQSRRLKVRLLSRLILGRVPRLVTFDLTKSLKATLIQLFVATPLDVLSVFIPALERFERRVRQRAIRQS